MIPVTKTYLPDINEYIQKVKIIWDSGWLTNEGHLEEELSQKLAKYLKVKDIQLVSNGTLALQLAIKALNLKGEIITTPYSYIATANVIVWEGCIPRFVDIDENTFCINADLIEDSINENTSAIMATHVYGYPCDVVRIEEIARKHNLKVIYDAAHCFGVTLNGKSLMDYGDISCLSFHATKLFHTAEGGGVVCKEPEISSKINLIKRFGHYGEENYQEVGINAKLSELHAAMGLCMLPIVDQIIERRRMIIELYDQKLGEEIVQRPRMIPGLEYNYHYYPVLFSSHDRMMNVRDALIEKNIFPRRYFYPSLNTLPFLQQVGYQECPVSESAASRVLCLPLYYELEENTIDQITNIIIEHQ